MLKQNRLALIALALCLWPSALRAEGIIKGKLPSGLSVLALAAGESARDSDAKFQINTASSTSTRLLAVNSGTGQLAGPVLAGIKFSGKIYTFREARLQKICRRSRASGLLGVVVKNGKTLSLGSISFNQSQGFGYLKSEQKSSNLKRTATAAINNNCAPQGTGANLGLSGTTGTSNRHLRIKAGDSDDDDGDGLPNLLDIDRDNDGILNAYDLDTPSRASDEVRVFSNLKLDLVDSVNYNANPALTTAAIDAALQSFQTLAIAVAGTNTDTVELDCGSLGYCSTGGTGTSNNGSSLPFPESFDPDSDGKGTISVGPTGDFQLETGATSAAIGAGNVLTEVVDESGAEARQVTGMLNFAFITNPAVKSYAIDGDSAVDVSYPVDPSAEGTNGHCIAVPSSPNASITFTIWRPQRPGISAAGEESIVDIGKSIIVVDIPNAPAVGSPTGNGPGNCQAGYSESDTNLQLTTNGSIQQLTDIASDATADPANTVTFTLDVDACLAATNGGAITWDSGETIQLDIQFKNTAGDNAAQKICFVRL